MTTRFTTTLSTPLGPLRLVGDEQSLHSAFFDVPRDPLCTEDAAPLAAAVRELEEYFAGERRTFTIATEAPGTAWQRRVWDALRAIPYGETRTYGDLAAELGATRAARAVGAANGRNPLAVVVPCHRVVGAGGRLTGYAGGLDRKRALLALERG